MTPLNVHWFDGRSTRARPAQALLQASPQGPVLWLRPEGGAPFAVPRKDVQWPERWSARRTPETLSIDLGPHGSLQVHDPYLLLSLTNKTLNLLLSLTRV